jgi:hypothetical protein
MPCTSPSIVLPEFMVQYGLFLLVHLIATSGSLLATLLRKVVLLLKEVALDLGVLKQLEIAFCILSQRNARL